MTRSRMAIALGVAGLLPFAGAAGLVWAGPLDWQGLALSAQLWYGAVILSFLGGIVWGRALTLEPEARAAGWIAFSVVPSLIGWAALFWPAPTSHWVLIGGFLVSLLTEANLRDDGSYPRWFWQLRQGLTLGAVICLAAGAASTIAI